MAAYQLTRGRRQESTNPIPTIAQRPFEQFWRLRVGKSIAMGYVTAEYAEAGTILHVEILGTLYNAEVLSGPIYDGNGSNMRS